MRSRDIIPALIFFVAGILTYVFRLEIKTFFTTPETLAQLFAGIIIGLLFFIYILKQNHRHRNEQNYAEEERLRNENYEYKNRIYELKSRKRK